jgi:hypothetical protein
VSIGAVATAEAAPHTTKAPCIAKPVTVGGAAGTQFCGPGTATVKAGGKTYSFKDGFCAYDTQDKLALQLSLGTDIPVFGSGKPNHGRPLFELTLTTSAKSGTLLVVDLGGRKLVPGDTQITASYSSSAALKGTFKGKGVTGTWNCHGSSYKLNQG